MPMIVGYTVPWVAVEHSSARTLAAKWTASKQEQVAAAGWSGLVGTQSHDSLDLAEIETLLLSMHSPQQRRSHHFRLAEFHEEKAEKLRQADQQQQNQQNIS